MEQQRGPHVKRKQTTFIDLSKDVAFKKIMGQGQFLSHFLNTILPARHQVSELRYLPQEQLPKLDERKVVINDLHVMSDRGESLSIEIQNNDHRGLAARLFVYLARLIENQLRLADNRYENMKPVHCVCIANFLYLRHTVSAVHHLAMPLPAPKGEEPLSYLNMHIIDLVRFNKELDEVVTDLDKWLYFMKNSDKLDEIPEIFKQDELFTAAFEAARYVNLTEEEMLKYDRARDNEVVYEDIIETAKIRERERALEEGLEQGIEQGKLETARKLLAMRFDIDLIMEITELSRETIEDLAKQS